uniref:N/A n=1 Tax=Ganoderma boninense TaxID=34458 RepID=A0A5K1JV91_9APHY|nr:N/A [Ganoderma boninense]
MSSSSRVWLITGTSSGFGLEMARLALANGERVIATLRKPEVLNDFASQYTSQQLLVLRLDVSQPAEITAAFAKAKAAFGRVDVVFNNAGYAVAGEAEGVPDDAARATFEVNFWGAVHVSQEAVRFFREENTPQGGHLIQNSAGVALVTLPTFGFYTAAKHALDGFTETLHSELNPAWKIKITSVLFGGFTTEFGSSVQQIPPHPAYGETAAAGFRKMFDGVGNIAEAQKKLGFGDPKKGIQKVYELSKLPNPPHRLLLGKDVNGYVQQYIAHLTKETTEYATWSDNVGWSEGN